MEFNNQVPPVYYPSTNNKDQLTLPLLLDRARTHFGDSQIITRVRNGWHRTTFREHESEARQLASALRLRGINPGDRIGSFMNNSARHFCLYHAVPCFGAVLHTLNIKIQPDHIKYTIESAQDSVIFVDEDLVDTLLQVNFRELSMVKFIVICGADMTPTQQTTLTRVAEATGKWTYCYDRFVQTGSKNFNWAPLNEYTASGICYTSGTTGLPKGVVYSHRSTILSLFVTISTDHIAIRATDNILFNVPMYHALGWNMPYSILTTGASVVMLGKYLTPQNMLDACLRFRITQTQGVPTVMNQFRAAVETIENTDHANQFVLERICCGGGKPSFGLMQYFFTKWNVEFSQAWGMTETNPHGTFARLRGKNKHQLMKFEDVMENPQKAGLSVPLMQMKLVDSDNFNREIPWDGKTTGELFIRGPFVTGGYLGRGDAGKIHNGWFETGDICTINSEGYMEVKDRSKDLIKSGGEWISSVDLENSAQTGFSQYIELCCAIGVPHPRWEERPVLVVQLKDGASKSDVSLEKVRNFMSQSFKKFQLPDDIIFMTIPVSGTGKLDKKVVRQQLKSMNYQTPDLRQQRAKL